MDLCQGSMPFSQSAPTPYRGAASKPAMAPPTASAQQAASLHLAYTCIFEQDHESLQGEGIVMQIQQHPRLPERVWAAFPPKQRVPFISVVSVATAVSTATETRGKERTRHIDGKEAQTVPMCPFNTSDEQQR